MGLELITWSSELAIQVICRVQEQGEVAPSWLDKAGGISQCEARRTGSGGRTFEEPALISRFLRYVSGQSDVWVASRAEVAQHWRATFPYEPTKAQDKVKIPRNVNPFQS